MESSVGWDLPMVTGVIKHQYRIRVQMREDIFFEPFFERFGIDVWVVILRHHSIFGRPLPNFCRRLDPTLRRSTPNNDTTSTFSSRPVYTWKLTRNKTFMHEFCNLTQCVRSPKMTHWDFFCDFQTMWVKVKCNAVICWCLWRRMFNAIAPLKSLM